MVVYIKKLISHDVGSSGRLTFCCMPSGTSFSFRLFAFSAGILQAKGVRPSLALSVTMQVIQSIFDKPCFQVDRLQLSPGELIAMANHAETLRFPHHTERERTYLLTFRALCRLKLASLMSSEDPDDFSAISSSVPHSALLPRACACACACACVYVCVCVCV